LRYPLVIKRGWLENPRTKWGLAGKNIELPPLMTLEENYFYPTIRSIINHIKQKLYALICINYIYDFPTCDIAYIYIMMSYNIFILYIYYRPPTTCSFRRPSLILSFGALDDVFSRSVAPGGWLRRVECLRLKLQLEGADGRPSYGLLEGKFMEIMVILCVFLWFYGKL
jgi:hypothetical protein